MGKGQRGILYRPDVGQPLVHRDSAAMNGAQILMIYGDSSGRMGGSSAFHQEFNPVASAGEDVLHILFDTFSVVLEPLYTFFYLPPQAFASIDSSP
jgi:hypothetical protein